MRLAPKLGHGLFFASPVFDGAAETVIKSMLELAGQLDQRSGDLVRRPHRRALRAET
mgnify:CR=1 FL=1